VDTRKIRNFLFTHTPSLCQECVVKVCCSVLQCVAVCCRVLQCVAVCCSVLQCVVKVCRERFQLVDRGSVLQCVAVCCSVLQCVAVCHQSVSWVISTCWWLPCVHCQSSCFSLLKILYTLLFLVEDKEKQRIIHVAFPIFNKEKQQGKATCIICVRVVHNNWWRFAIFLATKSSKCRVLHAYIIRWFSYTHVFL